MPWGAGISGGPATLSWGMGISECPVILPCHSALAYRDILGALPPCPGAWGYRCALPWVLGTLGALPPCPGVQGHLGTLPPSPALRGKSTQHHNSIHTIPITSTHTPLPDGAGDSHTVPGAWFHLRLEEQLGAGVCWR